MARIIIPFVARVNSGGVITFQGTAKGQGVYWFLVGHDANHNVVAALGSLKYDITATDSSLCTTNLYMGPATAPPDGYHDHLTVRTVL